MKSSSFALTRKFSTYIFKQKDYYNLSDLLLNKNQTSIANALSLCATWKQLKLGMQIHGQITKFGFNTDVFSANNVIRMYYKCGVLSNALRVFDEMPERNLVSWTLIVSGAVETGWFGLGSEVFVGMRRVGLVPNEYAIGSVLNGCSLEMGLGVHCSVVKIGLEWNPFVGSSLLSVYVELDDVVSAERVFESVVGSDIGCYNAMIGCYLSCGFGFEALKMVSLMRSEMIGVDGYTFINSLKCCSVLDSLDFGKQTHCLMCRSGVGISIEANNALMDMYFKCGGQDSAVKVFALMHSRDIISWNTVFSGLNEVGDGDAEEVITLFRQLMLTGLIPNRVTFSLVFKHCGSLLDLDLGLLLFCLAIKFGLMGEGTVISSLINMFAKCGAMKMAHVLFGSIITPNVTLWNDMIYGCTLNSLYAEALQIFRNLKVRGVEADERTFSCILEACNDSGDLQVVRQLHGMIIKSGFDSCVYANCSLIKNYISSGLLENSFKVFNGLDNPDLPLWGGMISALVHQGYHHVAFKIYVSFLSGGGKADEFILGSIINSSATTGGYQQTKSVHSYCVKTGFETHAVVASAITDAYAKCGDIEGGTMAFHRCLGSHDVVLYNTMIMAYAHHGLVMEAMGVFEIMISANLKPSQATFVSVISACSHLGFVDQGLRLFEYMNSIYKLKPSQNIYGCLVDLLSRNGRLEDARSLIESLPCASWPAILRSLLNGCRIHGNIELGEWAAEKLLKLVPENDAAYVLLSKLYSEGGYWEAAAKVRSGMVNKGITKDPGYTWIET